MSAPSQKRAKDVARARPSEKSIEIESPNRRAVSVDEACRMLGIGRSLGFTAAADGTLPTVRVGRRLLVPLAALDRMLAEASNGPESRCTERSA